MLPELQLFGQEMIVNENGVKQDDPFINVSNSKLNKMYSY